MIKSALVSVSLARSLQTQNDLYEVSLTNSGNTEYSAKVFIGSKQQPLNLIVDTQASEIWFAGPNCPPTQCTNKIYDTAAS